MKILALRRRPEACVGDRLVDRAFAPSALAEMIGACDDIVVAAPLTPDTRRLVGRREIAAMKSGGVFVNVGRGPVVDEATLVEALEAKRIRGAALDVFETEPLPAGHPLYRLENVLLSPHSADHTPDWLDQSMECFLTNLERFRKGEDLVTLVDKARGY
jgi:phosphoglycerate dehydrogenase-like enzyme